MAQQRFLPLSYLVDDLAGDWSLADGALVNFIVAGQRSWETGTTRTVALDLYLSEEATAGTDLSFAVAGLDSVRLVLPGSSNSEFTVEADLGPDFEVRLTNLYVKLVVETDLLQPVSWNAVDEVWEELDEPFEIAFDIGTVTVTGQGDVTFTVGDGILIPAVAIGSTGIVVEAEGLQLYFSSSQAPPAGREPGFRGFGLENVTVYLPPGLDVSFAPEEISVQGLVVGTGGVSATLSATFGPVWSGDTVSGSGSGTLGGFAFALREIDVAIVQNAVTRGRLSGELAIPFLDEVVRVDVGLTADGGFTLQVTSATAPSGSTDPTADDVGYVAVITKPGLGTFRLASLALEIDGEDVVLTLGGDVTLDVGAPAVKWPTIQFDGLKIGTDGSVKVPGGWITLPEPVALDLVGFKLEISQIGFGTETGGRRWVGCSGGLTLVAGITAGASVEGLRVSWDPTESVASPELSLRGVGVELEIPNALRLAGHVSMERAGEGFAFRGGAALELVSLGVSVDVGVLIGRNTTSDPYTYLLLTATCRLPVGIPIGCTGAAIYGFIGLLGVNVEPGRDTGMTWYQWYKEVPPAFDVTDPDTKWTDARDAFALGAGIVVGTLPDAAYSVSAKALVVVLVPGPVILVQGQANVLEVAPDVGDAASSGVLNALAVLDANEGYLQITIDAGWSVPKVLEISAAAEAFFSFADASAWHLYIGQKTPESLRIRADVLGLIHADSYFMLSATGLEQGFQAQLGDAWTFGPVDVTLRAWLCLETNVVWRPVQVAGTIGLGGEVAISVAGFGLGVSVEAELTVKAPTPYWVHGMLAITVSLPFPIPELEAEVEFTWTEPATPDLSDPVEAIAVQHDKFTVAWATVLHGDLGDIDPATTTEELPVVPLDARPVVRFAQSMNDSTGQAFSPTPDPSSSPVGDHTLRWYVVGVELWVRHKNQPAATAGWTDVSSDLEGAWLADEERGAMVGRKLQVLGKNPFAYASHASRSVVDDLLSRASGWPCVDVAPPGRVCINWEGDAAPANLGLVFAEDNATFLLPIDGTLEVAGANPWGLTRDVLWTINIASETWIALPVESTRVWVAIGIAAGGNPVVVRAWARGTMLASVTVPAGTTTEVAFDAPGTQWIEIENSAPATIRLFRICYVSDEAAKDHDWRETRAESIETAAEQWSSKDEIFEPDSWYALVVRTSCERTDSSGDKTSLDYASVAFFQTVGPPGITPEGMIPEWLESGWPRDGEPADLSGYVQWTIPEDGAPAAYRGYNLGAEFNENYVEQMYGSRVRILLVEEGGAAIVSADGEAETFSNAWGETATATLSSSESAWVDTFTRCGTTSVEIPGETTVSTQTANDFDDDFGGDLSAWTEVSDGSGAPAWSVASGAAVQTATVDDGDTTASGLPKLGTMIVAGASTWTAYEMTLRMRLGVGAAGFVLRYTEDGGYYRFSIDRTLGYRRLVRVNDGTFTELWSDTTVPAAGEWLDVRTSCYDGRIRVQIDEELVVDVEDDAPLVAGSVGLYTWGTGDAAFDDVVVRSRRQLRPQASYRASLMGVMPLLAEDFADGIDHHWETASGTGTATLGIGAGAGPSGEDTLTVASASDSGSGHADGGFVVTGHSTGWPADCELETDVRGEGVGWLGLVLRWTAATDFVLFEWNAGTGVARLVSRTAGADDERWVGSVALTDTEWHHVSFVAAGTSFSVTVDGAALCSVDVTANATGKVALAFNGAVGARFANVAAWTTPETEVHRWSFATSRYDGWADHLGSFDGTVVEEVLAASPAGLAAAKAAAATVLGAADASLSTARATLASADDVDRAYHLSACQAAADARWDDVAAAYDALAGDGVFALGYRPLPPRVEVTALRAGTVCHALLIESPEPLDAHRLTWSLRESSAGSWVPVTGAFLVWNGDGTRAFLFYSTTGEFPAGSYRLEGRFALDVGGERPVLRRAGATAPEIARIELSLA